MKQSSSTAQNMLIEEVKVRGGVVFRSDALESENKGVQAFAIVIPLSSQEQWLFLSAACSSSRCCLWSYPAGYFQKLLKYTAACVGWSFHGQSASSPSACAHGREWCTWVGNEGSWIFYSYSQHFAAVLHKRYSNSLPWRLLNKDMYFPFLLGGWSLCITATGAVLAVKWK